MNIFDIVYSIIGVLMVMLIGYMLLDEDNREMIHMLGIFMPIVFLVLYFINKEAFIDLPGDALLIINIFLFLGCGFLPFLDEDSSFYKFVGSTGVISGILVIASSMITFIPDEWGHNLLYFVVQFIAAGAVPLVVFFILIVCSLYIFIWFR